MQISFQGLGSFKALSDQVIPYPQLPLFCRGEYPVWRGCVTCQNYTAPRWQS